MMLDRLGYLKVTQSKSNIIIAFILAVGLAFLTTKPAEVKANSTEIVLLSKDGLVVDLGKAIYQANCAACHGVNLEGQENWTVRDDNGYMPAPPHDESGHTWHHPDQYLFEMTKYGIEALIGRSYPNNMPIYEGVLTDEEIVAVLSYIKSTWSDEVQGVHDTINENYKN